MAGTTCPEPLLHSLPALIDSLRRAVRLKNHAMATEETYVYWNRRFCHQKLGLSPQAAGPPAITAYLDFLALKWGQVSRINMNGS